MLIQWFAVQINVKRIEMIIKEITGRELINAGVLRKQATGKYKSASPYYGGMN